MNCRTWMRSCAGRWLCVLPALLIAVGTAFSQDIATKGSISGKVSDSTGAVIPAAKVTLSGPTGEKVATANETGDFEFTNLIPGKYNVKAELSGFKATLVPDVEVFVGKTSSLKLTLEAGNITEVVEVTAGVATVDTTSTAVGANLNDQLYENLPLQRSVTSLFYLAPGATDSLGGGRANPSISGGSALDNQYVADGVNITDSAFGGLGVFTRVYGTLGVGINTSYIKEVQVKTAGFEPQYGQSTGGIINIITKSGGTEYHGTVFSFFQPESFEATRRQPDDLRTNKNGKILHQEGYDTGFDIGGPVPGLKNRLFFFGSFNPSINRDIVRGAAGSGLTTIYGDQTHRRKYTKNYAAKIDLNINPNHQLNFSVFGDPTTSNSAPWNSLNIDNTTANSILDYGTRNIAVRYNGALSSSWTLSSSFSQGQNNFNEIPTANYNQIIDRTNSVRGVFTSIGLGFTEPTNGTTYRYTIDTTKQANFLGSHTFGAGYQFQRAYYSGIRDRSGPKFVIPAFNATGVPLSQIAGNSAPLAIGQLVNAAFSLRPAASSCTLCPLLTVNGQDIPVYLRQDRGEFGGGAFNTNSKYHAAYAQDTWRINKYITALVGYRWEQERLIGSPGSDGTRLNYVFVDNWSPRLGVTVDPFGKGKTKVYYNFGRFHEYVPLDMAERSLSSEKDFTLARFAPDFVTVNGVRRAAINSFGTVTPIIDAAHLLSGATGGTGGLNSVTISAQDPTNPILPGTKLGYAQEHVVGFEQQLPHNFVVSVRYIDRSLKRIIEDAAVVAPEASAFFGQTYFIGNITKTLDAAVNPIGFKVPANTPVNKLPSQCDPDLYNPEVTDNAGNVLGGICYAALGKNGKPAGDPGADGVPDGFPDPVHKYHAVEIEVNKRFANNWQLLANWRIAKVEGNYEGHYRNDNGQTDPAISSLFDFTAGEFNLLGDQFAVGPLNTDRRHVVNIYGSYAIGETGYLSSFKPIRGLNIGAGLHMESGLPISEFLAHPVYANAGEIPVGGRGKLGRTPFYAKLDLHADYPFRLSERMKLSVVADFFNVTNNTELRIPDQRKELTLGQDNVDFLKPNGTQFNPIQGYYLPFNMRLGVKFEF
jgi:hypothetical protein